MSISQKLEPINAAQKNKKFGALWGIVAFLVLTGSNVLIFYSHYTGELTFPWDFVGGYHAQAFSWYADGSFFHPPNWFPWGDLGFPAYWALQSGAFYFPLALLDALNQPYTIEAATILQVLHVLAGALGMYVLLRRLHFSPALSLIGGLAFHFSSSFYSNAQHVDIIRASAFLPWLMWSLHPAVILRSYVRPIIATLLVFQFLISAYPGSIVSSAYTLATFIIAYALPSITRERALHLMVVFTLVGASAIGMAMLKWLPPLAEGDWVSSNNALRMPLDLPLLLTIFLPYDKSFLPNDLTMRSLWLPSALLMGAIFLSHLSYTSKVALGLIALALLSSMSPALIGAPLPLPGFNISRFPLSDWRPTLHIGLILLACDGWRSITSDHSLKSLAQRLAFAGLAFLLICWLGTRQGYSLADFRLSIMVTAAAAMMAMVFVVANRFLPRKRAAASTLMLVGLGALILCDGYTFHHSERRSWQMGWNANVEKQLYDYRLSRVRRDDRSPLRLKRRPERYIVGEEHENIVQLQNSVAYNKCFYAPLFCALGYNNLRLSLPHANYRQAVTNAVTGSQLLAFVKQPQKLFVFSADAPFDLGQVAPNPGFQEIESLVPGVEGAVTGYGSGWARYRLSTPRDVHVVENEIWTKGWSLRLCRNGQCLPLREIEHTPEYLRMWTVPAGAWDVEVFFQIRSERYAWYLFYLGILLALSAGVFSGMYVRITATKPCNRSNIYSPTPPRQPRANGDEG